MSQPDEPLKRAAVYADCAVEDLQKALREAQPIEALLLLQMIGDAAKLRTQIDALCNARVSG